MSPSDLRAQADRLLAAVLAFIDAEPELGPLTDPPTGDRWLEDCYRLGIRSRRFGRWLHRTANRMDRAPIN